MEQVTWQLSFGQGWSLRRQERERAEDGKGGASRDQSKLTAEQRVLSRTGVSGCRWAEVVENQAG